MNFEVSIARPIFFVVVLFSKISKTVSNSPSPSVLGERDSWVYVQGPQPCHSHLFLVHSFRESHDTDQVKNNISSFQIFSLKIYNRIKLKAKSLKFCVVYILYFVCFIFKNNYVLNYSIVFEYLTHIHETRLKRYCEYTPYSCLLTILVFRNQKA